MNRRAAISRFFLLGGAGAAAYTGVKTFQLYKSPDIGRLDAWKEVLDELAETIIPRTDTPGAKEAGVGAFVIRMVKDCTNRKSQNKFLTGLDDLMNFSASQYGRPFIECTTAEKADILHRFQKKGKPYPGIMGKVERKLVGDSFFTTLKKYTVLGYCTSRPGATEGLAYDYIPGKYEITPLKQGQKAWATQ